MISISRNPSKRILVAALLGGAVHVLIAATVAFGAGVTGPVTFTRDVAPILHEHCVTCHRPGEAGPMSLRTFDEARPWARSIREKVISREMPPWFADPAHGTFRNDARLTDEEIETIVAWIDGGAKKGNPADMPPFPEFTEGWQMGEPDHIIELPPVDVPAGGGDYFPDLRFKADVPEGRWVRAIEIRPSALEVAHHVVVFMGGVNVGMSGQFDVLGVWAVGTAPNVYPAGMGRRIEPGQRLTANMHYHPNGVAQTDVTRIGLHFGEGPLEQEITAALAGSVTFNIPAGAENHREKSSWYVDRDIQLVSFFPHMHLRGKDMKFEARYPDGREEILLSVPNYDFDWQLFYYPEELLELPAGTRIDITAHYDNSANNPNNPDPTRDVYFGTASTDEMMFGIFEYVYADGGVELTAGEKLREMARTLDGEAYDIAINLFGNPIPSMLHLPESGDGSWIIAFSGTQIPLTIENVMWTDNVVTGRLDIALSQFRGTYDLHAERQPDGTLRGSFKTVGSGIPLPPFEGTLIE